MKQFFLILFLFLAGKVNSQTHTQTIRGTVIDADSKFTIPGANVILMDSDSLIGAVTDIKGSFSLQNVPVGRRAIKISSLGYNESMLNNVIVSSGKEVVLHLELSPKVYQTATVEVESYSDKTKANNDLVTVSSRNFQAEESNRYAGSRADPSKMVANYAGVSSANDARNDIIVRGNSPLGVLWRLEGVDIPNPNHFSAQGATGGPISMLNNNVLGNSDFLTGAFPAEYGNKTAAVFDLKLRNGNNARREFTGQLGINGIELGAEGPISKKQGSSYLVNYRYSTLEIFNKLGIRFGVSATPEYQDLSYKINLPTKKSGVLQLWGIGGLSKLELLDSDLKPDDWSYISKGQDLVFKTGMGAAGLTHLFFFNPGLSGRLSLSVSGTELDAHVDTLSIIDRSSFLNQKNKSTEGNVIGSYTLTNKLNSQHLIKGGLSWQVIYFDSRAFEYSHLYGKYIDKLNVQATTASLVQSFVHWQFRPTEVLTFNTGLHYQNFLLNNNSVLEPRLGMKWQLNAKQMISIGYGMHSQMQPTIYYFYESYDPSTDSYHRSNKHLDFSKSHHTVLAYDYNFKKDYRLKLESYYQFLYDVPVQQNYSSSFSMINLGNALEGIPLVDSLTNKGEGENYGIEMTIEKFFSRQFYFLLSASLYNSTYRGSSNESYSTSYNGNYVFNLLGGYELPVGKSKNRSIAFDLKYTQAGGNRYTPINSESSKNSGMAVYYDDQAFSKKQKDYSRFDIKLSYRSNRKKISQSIFVVVENLINTKNILRQTYNVEKAEIQTEYQLGLFPYFGYRIEF